MTLKSVEKIRDEWCDAKDRKISDQSLEDLKQYLKGEDEDKLCRAISLVTDARLMQFVPLMAKHLHHEDDYVRESLIGKLLTILKLPDYAEIGFKMAQEDEDSGVRSIATGGLGYILDKVDDQTKILISSYLCKIVENEDEDIELRRSAYESIMTASGLSIMEQRLKPRSLRRPEDLDQELMKKFKEKYFLIPKPRKKQKAKERNKRPKI